MVDLAKILNMSMATILSATAAAAAVSSSILFNGACKATPPHTTEMNGSCVAGTAVLGELYPLVHIH